MSETTNENLEFYTPAEVRDRLRISNATLRSWRRRKAGPPVVRFSHKVVRYEKGAFETWFNEKYAK